MIAGLEGEEIAVGVEARGGREGCRDFGEAVDTVARANVGLGVTTIRLSRSLVGFDPS